MAETKKEKKGSVLQSVMVGLLILAAFAIGSMWTELKVMKKGVQPATQQGQGQAGDQVPPEEATEVSEDIWAELVKDPFTMKGEKNAQVTIVEFTDYECPFCKRYVDDTFNQIDKDYIATGKVNYIIRNLPLSFHQFAQKAAEAALCAGSDQYLAYHDLLFKDQDKWSAMTAVDETFVGYAKSLGINEAKFRDCLANETMKEIVAADSALAGKAGLGGTPSFVINGKILVGAQPYTAFQTVIDEALK